MRTTLALARADFLERVRRHGFLVTLGLTVWAARAALPPRGAGYQTVSIGHHRALYDSAGVGAMVALLTGVFLSLIGFYLVKGAVERDRRSGVGEILGATRMSRLAYVSGKVLSNGAVLAVITAVMLVVAAAMQLVLGEDRHLDPLALATPFVLLTLPAMLLVAALAVLSEMVPRLRGGLGNLAYFFLFVTMTAAGTPELHGGLPIGDPAGTSVLLPSLERACARQYPDFTPGSGASVGVHISEASRRATPFRWEGLRWTARSLGGRAGWVAVAVLLTMVAAGLFDRFAEARMGGGAAAGRRRRGSRPPGEDACGPAAAPAPVAARNLSVAALTVAPRAERFLPLLRGEVRMMLRGLGRWWLAAALVLVVLCLFLPLGGIRAIALPLAAIWPILAWSSMGWRERAFGADALLFSAPRPLRRQLLATWLAGVLLAAAMTGPYALRVLLAGEMGSLAGWLAGALFIPSFALASGVWTGSGKLFEVGYLVLWYVGPLNRVPRLDYLGIVPDARDTHTAFLALALALLALAYAGRARQVRG